MLPETIKMDGVGFTVSHILSFDKEEDFIITSKEQVYQHLPVDQATKNLKTVYRSAWKLKKSEQGKTAKKV